MPRNILVISACDTTNQKICDLLHTLGHATVSTSTLALPSSLKERPATCLVDLQLGGNCKSDEWRTWLQDCHATLTTCLAFDSLSSRPGRDAIADLAPLADTLSDPYDQEVLADKVASLLTIRKLTRQLELTRFQLAHQEEELKDALQSAAHIQRSLIPSHQPRHLDLHYSWQYMPCKKVGGDLFNVVQLDEQTVMTYLVDVSGHGISSAMVTVSVHQSLSVHTGQIVKKPVDQPPFYEITQPGEVLKELEKEYPFERFEEFFTISYLLINARTGQLRYSNAGHPPPILLRRDGCVERLEAGGTIIGIGSMVGFEEGNAHLERGDRVFLYTDGITEHFDSSGQAYGEERLLACLKEQQSNPLDMATRGAMIGLREFGGSTLPADDVTLIGMEFNSPRAGQGESA